MSFGRRHRHFWFAKWFAAAGLALSGCSSSGDGLPRQSVAGTVLVDGRRLSYGSILLYPEAPPSHGVSVSCGQMIIDGHFSIPRENGPIPGMYKISISGATKRRPRTDRETSPGKAEPPAAEKIPVRFNGESELEVEVKEGGIKDLRIELDSK